MFSVKFVSGHVFLLFLFCVFLRLFSALCGEIGTWIGKHIPEEPEKIKNSPKAPPLEWKHFLR